MDTINIYGLCCPDTNIVKYVGKTSLPLKRRLGQHINKSNSKNKTKKNEWIIELLKNNKKPYIILLEIVTNKNVNSKEKVWILKFGLPNLVNGNIGGGGNNGDGILRNNAYKSKFINYMNESNYSKQTKNNYISYINSFIDYFKNELKSPKEINSKQIDKYISLLKNRNTRNVNITALKLFYIKIMNQPLKLNQIKYEYL